MSEQQYLDTLRKIHEEGHDHGDRTGTGRRSIFGVQTRFDLSDGTIPVITTRKIYTRAIIAELLWFIQGNTNNADLNKEKVNIWNKWAVSESDIEAFVNKYFPQEDEEAKQGVQQYLKQKFLNQIGPMYGAMWRNAPRQGRCQLWPNVPMSEMPSDKLAVWKGEYSILQLQEDPKNLPTLEEFCTARYYDTVDQLNELIRNLKARPYSSRLVVSAWIPEYVAFETLSPQENVLMGNGSLAPCHAMFQCIVTPPKEEGGKKRLSLMMTQRSTDVPIGLPYNIAQYSLLLAMIAQVVDMEPYEFIHSSGDTHYYFNQKEGVEEQITRKPLAPPRLWLNPEVKDLFQFKMSDIEILDYQHLDEIKYPVSV